MKVETVLITLEPSELELAIKKYLSNLVSFTDLTISHLTVNKDKGLIQIKNLPLLIQLEKGRE